jgi:hypothetical protein
LLRLARSVRCGAWRCAKVFDTFLAKVFIKHISLGQFQMRTLASIFCSTVLLASPIAFAEDQAAVKTDNQAAELGKIIDTERTVFGAFHLAPIIIPEGEQVGDIIDVGNATLIAGADDCFPKLSPRKVASQLPAITISSEKGLAAALGVEGIAEGEGETTAAHSFILDFQDVQVQRVSLFQLRTLLKRNIPECDTVRPFIDSLFPSPTNQVKIKVSDGSTNRAIAVSDRLPPLLVGMLFTARRVVHVRTSNELDGVAKASVASGFLQKFGLGAKFRVSGGDKGSSMIDLVGVDSIPVAFAPAFVVANTTKLADNKIQYELTQVDPAIVLGAIREARREEETKIAELLFGHTDSDSLMDRLGIDQATWRWSIAKHPLHQTARVAEKAELNAASLARHGSLKDLLGVSTGLVFFPGKI